MAARRTPPSGSKRGNFIAEWFGHRVWPTVALSDEALADQRGRRCPFLSFATGENRTCVKTPSRDADPTGVCTISSDANGTRQDWLACPYRILDRKFTLLSEAVRVLYRLDDQVVTHIVPVTVLRHDAERSTIRDMLVNASGRVFAFAADKLGGEVDLPETAASPGSKVDVSIIEILAIDPATGIPSAFGQHVFFEIQTADFHGSPLHAVKLLQELCPRDSTNPFHAELAPQNSLCGTGVEGPNKANIFKRTIYQMILKVRLAEHAPSAGFAIILPLPVWDSWLRHLAVPHLRERPQRGSAFALAAPNEDPDQVLATARTWVLVFDIEREHAVSPHPLSIIYRIATSADALTHYAFTAASQEAIAAGVIDKFRATMSRRVTDNWTRPNGA